MSRVLVTDEDLPTLVFERQRFCAGEDIDQRLTFIGLGSGQCPSDREAMDGGNQMQSQPPEEP